MLGIEISLTRLPGVGPLLAQLDSLKAKFLAVPAAIKAQQDRLARVRVFMTQNGAPISAFADVTAVENSLRAVNAEWNVAASAVRHLDELQRAGKVLSLDALTSVGTVVANVSGTLKATSSLTSAVDALAAKYLTAQQRSQLTGGGFFGGVVVPSRAAAFSGGALLALGLGAFLLLRRR